MTALIRAHPTDSITVKEIIKATFGRKIGHVAHTALLLQLGELENQECIVHIPGRSPRTYKILNRQPPVDQPMSVKARLRELHRADAAE